MAVGAAGMAVLVAVVVLSAAVFFLASDAVRAVAQHGPPTPQPSAVAAAVNTLIAGVERTRAAVTASAPRRTATSTVSATWTPTFTVTASPSPTPTFTASPTATHTPTATTLPTPTETPRPAVLIGAGDISVCGLGGDFLTAALIERLLWQYPWAQVFTAGDNAQSMGTAGEYNDCFHQSWGRFKDRIRPSPGNHDWYTDSGGPYFDYFGEAAGPRGLGYYSYDLGDWHIVSLNSACDGDDHCSEGTAQAQWLRDDLSRNQGRCTLLYWHHPEFSSGTVPYSGFGRAFWQIASDYGADVVVNGHDHHYERFAPMDRDGQINYANGTRVFIAATGGAWRFELGDPHPATEARDKDTLGALVFKLYPGRYEWQFVPVDGGTFMDSGVGGCR